MDFQCCICTQRSGSFNEHRGRRQGGKPLLVGESLILLLILRKDTHTISTSSGFLQNENRTPLGWDVTRKVRKWSRKLKGPGNKTPGDAFIGGGTFIGEFLQWMTRSNFGAPPQGGWQKIHGLHAQNIWQRLYYECGCSLICAKLMHEICVLTVLCCPHIRICSL